MESYVGKTCRCCGKTLGTRDEVIICPACHEPYHVACWIENGGCAKYGCRENPRYKATAEADLAVCPACGSILEKGQQFCPVCGAPRLVPKKCPACGAVMIAGQKFCPACGKEVPAEKQAGAQAAPAPGPAAPAPAPVQAAHAAAEPENSQMNSGTVVKKKKKGGVAVIIIVVVLLLAAAVVLFPGALGIPQALMAQGQYKLAYLITHGEEKEKVLQENSAAVVSALTVDGLKDPGSFELVDAWYKNGDLILQVRGNNSLGMAVTNYWLYTFQPSTGKWGLFDTFTDLSEKKTYSWDTDSESVEKLLYNLTLSGVVKPMVSNKSLKLDKDAVKRINRLFEKDMLDEIKLVDPGAIPAGYYERTSSEGSGSPAYLRAAEPVRFGIRRRCGQAAA